MKTLFKETVKSNLSKALRGAILLIVFVLSSVKGVFAQADISNIKNSLSNIKEEQEKIAHEEFMSYVYMVLGFSVVIAIAWISTVKARSRSKEENEAKLKFIQQNLAKKNHGHTSHGHSSHGHAAHGHATLHKAKR